MRKRGNVSARNARSKLSRFLLLLRELFLEVVVDVCEMLSMNYSIVLMVKNFFSDTIKNISIST